MIDARSRVKILSESLQYIQRFYGKVIVVKYGGSALTEKKLRHSFMRDVVLLKRAGINLVVVHGGGPMISQAFVEHGIKSRFVGGIRVTDGKGMELVERVLCQVNREISELVAANGAVPVGMCGQLGKVICAKRVPPGGASDPSSLDEDMRNGEVVGIDPKFFSLLTQKDVVPVVCPIGVTDGGVSLNINADHSALAIAIHLHAEKLIMMTNVPGLLAENGDLLSTVSYQEAEDLVEKGAVHSGMLPKLQCAIDAVHAGVKAAHITDGREEHSLLLELMTDAGMGTLIEGN